MDDRSAPGDDAEVSKAYEALQIYTLEHGGPEFVHQHIVDAWAAQNADARTKPIALTFGLVGLCLRVEHGWTGRRVQRAHMDLARRKRSWPAFPLPAERGTVTPLAVMAAPPGAERDRAIDAWCTSVWEAYHGSHEAVRALLRERMIL